VVLEGILNLDEETKKNVLGINNLMRVLLALKAMPAEAVLKGLGGLGEDDKWILKREDVLELILRWGGVPFKDALKGLRKQEVTRLLLENGNLKPSDNILEGLGTLDEGHKIFIRLEILRAVLGMDEFPKLGVLQAVVDLPAGHGIFSKPPEVLRVILKYGLVPADTILKRLVWMWAHHYNWIFGREKFLRVVLDMETMPADAVLEGLRRLPDSDWIFEEQYKDILGAVLVLGRLPSGAALEGLRKLHIANLILTRKLKPTDAVLEGLGTFEDGDWIFEDLEVLELILSRARMLSDAALRGLRKLHVVKLILTYKLEPTDTVLEGLGKLPDSDWIFEERYKDILGAVLVLGRLLSGAALEGLRKQHVANLILTHKLGLADAILERLGRMEADNLIFLEPEVLGAILILGELPSEIILRALRRLNVARTILICKLIPVNAVLEGLEKLDANHYIFGSLEVLGVIMAWYSVLPREEILQGLIKPHVTELIQDIKRLPSDAVLEGLGKLDVNHYIFGSLEVLRVIMTRCVVLPCEEILQGLIKPHVAGLLQDMMSWTTSYEVLEGLGKLRNDHWIFEELEVLKLVLMYLSNMPTDAVLQVLRKPEILKVIQNIKRKLSNAVLEGLGKLRSDHGIFKRLRVLEMILNRNTMPSDAVLEGLGNLPMNHQIFKNSDVLRRVLNMDTMPNEEELQELLRY
jgi:hypothetical protein